MSEPGRVSSQTIVVDLRLDGVIVGPDQYLVLTSLHPLTGEQAAAFAAAIPEGLRGRVVLASEVTAHVVDVEDYCPACKGTGTCRKCCE